jgi:hypothetical protein
MDYEKFIASKKIKTNQSGFDCKNINPVLFDYQRDLVRWALRMGKAALFTMTGTGKTLMQCEWAINVHRHTGKDILILAPLAVSAQTVVEARKIGITITLCRNQEDVRPGLNITNYEKLEHFQISKFGGIVLDESSILKSFTSSTRNQIIEGFRHTPYKLACTATPAPNDFVELGNHAEFLDVMSRTEMLSMFFVHDGGDTSVWRLKGHAVDKFWEWCASWAAILSKPSDLGYSDDRFILPPLTINEHVVKSDRMDGDLFALEAQTLDERRAARKGSFGERIKHCVDIVNKSDDGSWLIWCDLNIESEALKKSIRGAVEVKGSDKPEHKESSMIDFAAGKIDCLVSKPSICGFGMNFQTCHNMAFVGLSDSFEQYFQAVRRCYRFGQKKPVNVHIITSEAEGSVLKNIKRKEADAMKMIESMVAHTARFVKGNIAHGNTMSRDYIPTEDMIIPEWVKGE